VPDRIEVDLKGNRHFAHGRHPFAGPQYSRAQTPQDLFAELDVDGDARIIETK
jgi:hypothetical protein